MGESLRERSGRGAASLGKMYYYVMGYGVTPLASVAEVDPSLNLVIAVTSPVMANE